MSIGLCKLMQICYNVVVEFSEWITDKYIQWRGKSIHNDKSIAKFAKMLGVSQQMMSEWMKPHGMIPKHKKNIDALIKVYGNEVYEVLHLEPPPDQINWSSFPSGLRSRLQPAMEEFESICRSKGILVESPEADTLLTEIFKKYGFSRTTSTE